MLRVVSHGFPPLDCVGGHSTRLRRLRKLALVGVPAPVPSDRGQSQHPEWFHSVSAPGLQEQDSIHRRPGLEEGWASGSWSLGSGAAGAAGAAGQTLGIHPRVPLCGADPSPGRSGLPRLLCLLELGKPGLLGAFTPLAFVHSLSFGGGCSGVEPRTCVQPHSLCPFFKILR